jgi:2'-5' RNA ligase
MSKIAVDVVFLPDEEMTVRTIEANAELVNKAGRQIILSKEDCLPHMSLAMGCIDRRDVETITKILDGIAKEYGSGVTKLRVTGVRIGTNSIGEKVSSFVIEDTKELQSLHERIMRDLRPYFAYDVSADMLCGSDHIADSTLIWIKDYPDKSSFTNFTPHITIGYGQAGPIESSIDFTASNLALCHLGNRCTCRQILALVELKK